MESRIVIAHREEEEKILAGRMQHFKNNKVEDGIVEVHFSGRSSKFVLTRATFLFKVWGEIQHAKFAVTSNSLGTLDKLSIIFCPGCLGG